MLPLHDVARKRHRKVTVKECSLLPKTHGHVNRIAPLLHRRDLDAAMSYDHGGGRMLRRRLLQSP